MDPSTLGKYELHHVLGRGAAGTVYEAWDPVIARKVAVKTVRLPPPTEAQDELARFRREAQAAGRLSHPGIVAAYDYGETADIAYIVMEFVDGRTLRSVLEAEERLPLPTALQVMDDVLAALEYSHGRGVVHRDIKPANVILTAEGRAKVADFGIARIESSNLTQAGTIMGTPAYMSPEQFMGQVVDRRTDIYACGVLLYQLLTGERPFEGSLTGVMHKALNTVPPRPSELSVTALPALDAVVARAMAKRPEDRYGSAAEFARAIHAAVAAPAAPTIVQDATIVAPPLARSAPPGSGRRGWLALGGAGLAAALGVAAWLLLAPGRTPEPPAPPGRAPAPIPDTAKLLPGTPDPSLAPQEQAPRQEARRRRGRNRRRSLCRHSRNPKHRRSRPAFSPRIRRRCARQSHPRRSASRTRHRSGKRPRPSHRLSSRHPRHPPTLGIRCAVPWPRCSTLSPARCSAATSRDPASSA